MNRIFKYIACLTLISSCKQDLCQYSSLSDKSTVQFSVDWSQSNIDPSDIHNLSIYAYPDDGGAPYLRVSGDIESGYINLPSGIYSLLVFNDIAGDIVGMNFRNDDDYSNFQAETIDDSSTSDLYYNMEDGEVLASKLGELAAWRMDEFEVAESMVSCPYCGEMHNEEILVEVAPTPITTQCIFKVRVENLNNAQIIQGMVKGLAAGAYLSSGDRISTTDNINLYSISFTSRTFDDTDYIDGTIESQITTFGKEPNAYQSYELVLDVVLNNGELISYERDITEQVTVQNNLIIYINLESDDNMIVLPKSSGTGFEVEAWGDKELIELL